MAGNAITLTPVATGHAFTRNPIMLSMPGTGWRVFSIYGQGYTSESPAYRGEITAPAAINLAEFIDAIIPPIADPGEDDVLVMYGLQDGGVTIEVDDGSQEPYTWQFAAHQGGVSKQNYRKLSQANTDIFAARFLNPACNFFLTTRTHDWRLNIKETELYPLVFFYPSQGTLAVQDIVSGNTVSLPASYNGLDYHGKLCALNLKAIRQYFLEEYNCITGVLDVLVDGTPSARIAIQEAKPQLERYRLKFRNSYGVFEVVELTGKAQWAPAINGDQEEDVYRCYMADVDDFFAKRQRSEVSSILNVSTGYKTNEELRFMLDAIASDEVYLLDAIETPVKVLITVDEMAYYLQPNGPQSFSLKLTSVEGDSNLTGGFASDVISVRGGLFSQEFSEQYD